MTIFTRVQHLSATKKLARRPATQRAPKPPFVLAATRAAKRRAAAFMAALMCIAMLNQAHADQQAMQQVYLLAQATTGTTQDFTDGQSLGQNSSNAAAAAIQSGSYTTTFQGAVPAYTANPPQTQYAGQNQQSMASSATVVQAVCQAAPTDSSCAGQTTATNASVRPVGAVTYSDPALGGMAVANNPSLVFGATNVATTFSACTVTAVPSTSTIDTCNINNGPYTSNTCTKTLTVVPTTQYACTPGSTLDPSGGLMIIDGTWVMVATHTQCDTTSAVASGTVPFAFGACIDCPGATPGGAVQINVSQPSPAAGQLPAPVWSTVTKYGMNVVAYVEGPGCSAAGCEERVWFFGYWVPGVPPAGFKLSGSSFVPVAGSQYVMYDMKFPNPANITQPGDYWLDKCTPYENETPSAFLPPDGTNISLRNIPALSLLAPAYCLRTNSVCTDGPSTKTIDGVAVTRACWAWEDVFNCTSTLSSTTCSQQAEGACSQSGPGVCEKYDASGNCLQTQYSFACSNAAKGTAPVANCPTTNFCPSGSCFNTTYPPDANFGNSVAVLEAGREAAASLNTANMTVFNGFENNCRDKVNYGVSDCCQTGNSGASNFNNLGIIQDALSQSYTNVTTVQTSQAEAQVLTQYSSYTYDALYTTDDISASVGAFSPIGDMTTSYMSAPTSLTTAWSSLMAGDMSVADFMEAAIPGPWTIALIIIMIIMAASACTNAEMITEMKKEAHLCHFIGSQSSRDFLGNVINDTQVNCCYPSILSRIINEQGKAQLGMSFGSASAPNCAGFTIAQLQQLDFSTMNFSEFIATISPQVPSSSSVQSNLTPTINCYYGNGKCQ